MKPQIKFFSFGFFFACFSLLGIFAYMLHHDGNIRMLVHDQVLPSGKTVQITSFNLVWGEEHSDRNPGNDCFNLEYVSNVPHAEPEVRDLIPMSQAEVAIDVPEQPGAGERIGLIDFIADPRQVGAAAHQFAGNVIGARARGGVLEGPGVGRDGGEETVCDPLGDGPLGDLQQAKDELSG